MICLSIQGKYTDYTNFNIGDFVIGLFVVGFWFYTCVCEFGYYEFTLRACICTESLKTLELEPEMPRAKILLK